MKKIIMFTDNILVRATTYKLSILLPENNGKISEVIKIKGCEVLSIGDTVKNINKGDQVKFNFNLLERAPVNNSIGAPENANDGNCTVYYYFVKEFDICAKEEA